MSHWHRKWKKYVQYIGSWSEDYALTCYKWNECFAWICAQAKCHAISCLSWPLDQSRVIDCHISGAPGCVGPKGCQALGIDPLIRLVDRRVKMNLHLYETASNSSTIINANGTCQCGLPGLPEIQRSSRMAWNPSECACEGVAVCRSTTSTMVPRLGQGNSLQGQHGWAMFDLSTEQDLQFGTSNIFTCLRFFSVPVTVPVPVTSFWPSLCIPASVISMFVITLSGSAHPWLSCCSSPGFQQPLASTSTLRLIRNWAVDWKTWF